MWVTGLYEESHGIVGNKMWDPEFKASFSMSNIETRWWDGGEPIWITAALQGKKSGVYFWPGSEVTIKNITATSTKPYNSSIPFAERAEQVIQWLKQDYDLVMTYYHEPDKTGHSYGPDSKEVEQAVKMVDQNLGMLIERLKEEKLLSKVDMLVVSDHGMAKVIYDKEHVLDLSEHDVLKDIERVVEEGVIFSFYPKPGRKKAVLAKLRAINFNMTVYRKEDIPEHFHYKKNRRVPPIVILPDEGYLVYQIFNATWMKGVKGEHGYSNDLVSMNPIFFARGPNFKRQFTMPRFETVNIYPMVCQILGLTPAPNNGSVGAIVEMFTSGGLRPRAWSILWLIGTLLLLLVL
ncbi:ENPP4 [Cordylochernes scorpioides]|uniref:ENPP4 n=1 Tax=Cordylochernes scorpioides TaxID=51811 RepID=A0ABY6JWT9_9ARAC|nr:ENPP4 [Cordylochernes scorpioides]